MTTYRTILSAAALAASALALAPSTAHAADEVLTVSASGVSSWGVGAAVQDWNAQGRELRMVASPDADIVVRAVNRPAKWWAGYTTFRADGTVSIVLNTAALDRSYRYHGSLATAKQWTSAHELGHALGLAHSDDARSTMSYDNNWHDAGTPHRIDYAALRD